MGYLAMAKNFCRIFWILLLHCTLKKSDNINQPELANLHKPILKWYWLSHEFSYISSVKRYCTFGAHTSEFQVGSIKFQNFSVAQTIIRF
jgi:hypothetical protein